MPNWVKNKVRFTAKKKDLLDMLEKISFNDAPLGTLDFNKVIPMPPSLNIESGSMTDMSIVYYASERLTKPVADIRDIPAVKYNVANSFSNDWVAEVYRRCKEWEERGESDKMDKMYADGKVYMDNYDKYGCTTWYDWCIHNWGTKWNSSCEDGGETPQWDDLPDDAECEYNMTFPTAWSTPFPVMEKLAELFPAVSFEVMYADEDLGCNCGVYSAQDGEIVENYEKTDSEAFEFACKVWGYDPDEIRAEYESDDEDELDVAEECKEENENEIPSLTPEMEECIYRKKQREYRRADAERQLTYYFFGTEDPDDDDLVGFEESHGYSFESLVSKSGERYICIDILVDMFEEAFDCNCAENDTWQAVIREYFNR